MLVRSFWHTGAHFVTGNYKRGRSVTEMKKRSWSGNHLRREGKWAGSPFYIKPYGTALPYHRKRFCARSFAHQDSQFIQIATNKNCLKYSFMPRTVIDWNSIPYTSKKLKTKTSLKQLLLNIFFFFFFFFWASNQFSQQRNCTNPTRSTPFRGVD